MVEVVTFDKNLKKEILDIFDKQIDSEGIIVEKDDPTQKVLSPDGDEVSINEFVGITKGSEVFIKSDLPSLIAFSKISED